jgi:hypothetical protein
VVVLPVSREITTRARVDMRGVVRAAPTTRVTRPRPVRASLSGPLAVRYLASNDEKVRVSEAFWKTVL